MISDRSFSRPHSTRRAPVAFSASSEPIDGSSIEAAGASLDDDAGAGQEPAGGPFARAQLAEPRTLIELLFIGWASSPERALCCARSQLATIN